MKALRVSIAALFLLVPATFAATITYTTILTGPNESPPNPSPGTGFSSIIVDTVANTLEVSVQFSGLLGTTTASHIHCCVAPPGTAPVATQTPTFTGFPLGVTSGTYDHVFSLLDPATYNQGAGQFLAINGGVAGAEAALLAGLANGTSYLNIHTTSFPNGEIRGFIVPAPEPATLPIAAVMLVGLVVGRLRLQRV